MQYRVQGLENQIVQLQNKIGDVNFDGASINSNKIAELEKEIQRLRTQTSSYTIKESTMICGGLPNGITEKDAKEWLKEKIANFTRIDPEIFCRGDFKGLIWAKFPDVATRDSI
eukprot:3218375-Karenia_brevis.AAC.1